MLLQLVINIIVGIISSLLEDDTNTIHLWRIDNLLKCNIWSPGLFYF